MIKEDSVEYDLYFVYDSSYLIQEGKVLGIRIAEYGSRGGPHSLNNIP